MKKLNLYFPFSIVLLVCVLILCGIVAAANGQSLDHFKYSGSFDPLENTIQTEGQFNGYTNYWHDVFWKWQRYGNLFQMSIPNVNYSIAQSKVDIAEELDIPGLQMQEGFLNGLLIEPYRTLEQPSRMILEEAFNRGNFLIYIDPATAVGKDLMKKLPKNNHWKSKLKSHQFDLEQYHELKAFYLENGSNRLFVVASNCSNCRNQFKELIEKVQNTLRKYDLHRGWFGAGTLLHSVTCHPGHPLEVIGKGMNQGNTWFTFSGYMDYMLLNQLPEWLSKVKLPIVTDVGISGLRNGSGGVLYGCKNYEGLKIQDTPGEEAWIKFTRKHNGYMFRPVYMPACDAYNYDGYIAVEGNKKQIDNENIPFILETGYIRENAPPCMILFADKGVQLTGEKMWEAIMSRKEAAVLPQGKIMGPKLYRNVLQMLLLDRVYLEEYYGDRIHVEAAVKDRTLIVTVINTYPNPVSGTLEITAAPEIVVMGNPSTHVILPANGSKTMKLEIQPTLSAMDGVNPIAVEFKWSAKKKGTLTILDLPPAISVHQLLFGHAPDVTYPVTIHNFSNKPTFPVLVQVFEKNHPSGVVYETTQHSSAAPGKFQTLTFVLQLPAGHYNVKVYALGVENISQLGVGQQAGSPYLYEVDLNGDGINEYTMENDYIRATLLTTGARIIEYTVKERNDNVFFKHWPKKAENDKEPFRERGFYPYGGFEDFLGQGSMENHRIYNAEILKKEGDFVRVRMAANYYGNKLEKIYTLYGNSPLMEVRFALTFKNPEANMLGPQPILELGQRHWTEDVFTVPSLDGLAEYRMRPGIGKRYGMIIDLKEGWNAGYDTKEDVSFVGAFPVSEPEFLHMFSNDPGNHSSHYYYIEFQPWVPIFQKSVMYFSYYFWGTGGAWENGVNKLRERNLITKR